ncbi:multi-sensor hybrid histidine kinase [Anabaenopsis circularis NIES-21]|uniref:histidine kinase n=1 Tax=Anabaenopsis circularis NIES-21 TaxID=1085406 RepID=A0A1Z4GJJ3_9CYAN|nr:multi-sensor hybrid histidine kinase [Anabaenopsis circularis NIES-21]
MPGQEPQKFTLKDVLITEELFKRAPRNPDWPSLNKAVESVARQMAANSPTLLQSIVDMALDLCSAGSAGINLLETTANGEEVFHTHLLAGALAQYENGTTKRSLSFCGVCVDCGSPQLLSHPERYVTSLQAGNTPIVEALVLPLIADNHTIGTIWVMSHDISRHFDSQDVRVMTLLADFTTAALLKERQTQELQAANAAKTAQIVECKLTEESLRALISNLPGGAVFVVDQNLRYLVAEGEALAIAGFQREDFVGRTIFEVLPSELATYYEPRYRQALAGEGFEHEHNAHDRSYISRLTPLRAENGEIYAVLAISYDITERKRAEVALRESEARFRAFVTASSNMVYRMSADWHQMRNLEGKKILVNTETPSQNWIETYIPLAEQSRVWAAIEAAIQRKSKFELEHQVIQQDGTIGWVFSRAIPMLDDRGDIIEWFGAGSDITARKQTEAALRESEAKYRSLFESINDAFALLKVLYDDDNQPIDCRFLEVSPSFEIQTGLPQAQGKTLRELIPSVESGWFEYYHQALVTNALVHFEMYQSYLNIWFEVDVLPYGNPQDRQVVIVFQNINDRKQAEAERLQLIQEQSAREQERQRAESLAELDRTKTTFFSNVSHEFRTPLTLILAPVQDALSDWVNPLPEVQRARLKLVHRNTLRLLKLVNTLLDFSRIEAGRMEAVYEPTELAMYTTELASVFRSAIEQAGLRLVVDCPPLAESVYVDRQMWEKIVLNLLSNAFKFTFEGEIAVRLYLADDHHVTLQVQDTGVGIEPEQLPYIMKRFYQVCAAKARTHEGSGIGLALVHELIKLHGGTLDVTSTPEVGSCFTVTIPLGTAHLPNVSVAGGDRIQATRTLASTALGATPYVQEAERWIPKENVGRTEAGKIGKTDSETNLGNSETNLRNSEINLENSETNLENSEINLRNSEINLENSEINLGNSEINLGNSEINLGNSETKTSLPFLSRVLIVDDNADMRDYLTRILSKYVEVEAVADGVAALAAVNKRVPDLVLSDVMMPELDGFGLLKALRANARTKEIPVILLSARADEESIVEGLLAGADDYLIKPFSANELVTRVNAYLQMANRRSQALHQERTINRRKDEVLLTLAIAR